MASNFVSDEEIMEALRAVEEAGGNQTQAGITLGVSRDTIRRRIKAAVRRNLTGDFEGGVVPPGYTLGKVTTLQGPNGTVMEWQHKLPDADKIEDMVEALIEKMGAEITPISELSLTRPVRSEFLTMYPIVDVHLGMYAWAKESGQNYDLDIAKEQFMRSTTELLAQTPDSDTALIIGMGDFFHADNNEAVTAKSHNHLDVDGRHDKVLHLGGELFIWHIDMALQKHKRVIVKVMRGNHDPYASKALSMALYFRYQGNSRVTVDREPLDLWPFEWGVNMLGFTHGDNVKAQDMPAAMAGLFPEMWGRTKYRFGFSGHYHKRRSGPRADEQGGAEWEILPAFTAKDAWNASMGFSSKRVILAKTFHVEEGLKYTHNVNVTVKGAK